MGTDHGRVFPRLREENDVGHISRNAFTNQMHTLFIKHKLPGKTQAPKKADRRIGFFSLSFEVVLELIQKEWDAKFNVLLGF